MFTRASVADCIRARQKDDSHVYRLQQQVRELVNRVVGGQRSAHIEQEVNVATALMYYGVTRGLVGSSGSSSGSPRVTLGEEFCEIAPVAVSSRGAHVNVNDGNRALLHVIPAPRMRQCFSLVLSLLVPYVYSKMVNHPTRMVWEVSDDQDDDADADAAAYDPSAPPTPLARHRQLVRAIASRWNALVHALGRLDPLVRIAEHAHLACFYLIGTHLHISSRLSGLHYMATRHIDGQAPSYRVFGVLMVLQLVLEAVLEASHRWHEWREQQRQERLDRERERQLEQRARDGDNGDNDDDAGDDDDDGEDDVVQREEDHASARVNTQAHRSIDHDDASQQHAHAHAHDDDDVTELFPALPFAQRRGRRKRAKRRETDDDDDDDDDDANRRTTDEEDNRDEDGDDDEDDPDEDDPALKCTLCLCRREHSTVTECGHVFCWVCITSWCTTRPECPLCRQPAHLHDLLALAHCP